MVELFREAVVNAFKDLNESRLESWLEEVIAIKGKREIVSGLSKAFNEPVVLLMDRKKPLGVFIKLDKESLKELPEEVRLFLSKALNAAGCKLLKQSVAQEGGV